LATRNPVTWLGTPTFPKAARTALADGQLRANLRKATGTIRQKRANVVAELDDWERLRLAGEAIKNDVLANLDTYLEALEQAVTARGTRPRRTRSCCGWPDRPARTRSSRSSRWRRLRSA
jgi:L-lactate dehydrogenase complex protein LldF